MNHQGVSEISFEESYTVPADQTAKSLFSRLPHGSGYSERLIECLATGYLVAVVESICIREMQLHVDDATEVVVGRTIRIDHLGPIPPGSPLRVRGWLERLGGRSATFRVQAHDAHEIVCEATVTLVATPRAHMESRITAKVLALQCVGSGTQRDLSLVKTGTARHAAIERRAHTHDGKPLQANFTRRYQAPQMPDSDAQQQHCPASWPTCLTSDGANGRCVHSAR